MAWDPCHLCARPFRGQSVYTYVTWPIGANWYRYRLRTCQDCAAEFRRSSCSPADWKNSLGEWELLDLDEPLEPRVVRLERRESRTSSSRSSASNNAAADRSSELPA